MIGYLVWWDLSNISISRKKMERIFGEDNLKKFNAAVKYRTVFSKVLTQVRKQEYSKSASIRLVSKNPKVEQVLVIVDEAIDKKASRIVCKQGCTIHFDCTTGSLTADCPHPVFDQIKELYENGCKQAMSRDIFLALVEILEKKTDGFKLRDTGGFYFVPATGEDTLAALKRLFSKISEGHIFCVPVKMTSDLRKALHRAFSRHIHEVLSDIRMRHRVKGFTARVAMFKTQRLKPKVDYYLELLGEVDMDDLYRAITDQDDHFRKLAIQDVKNKPRKRKSHE